MQTTDIHANGKTAPADKDGERPFDADRFSTLCRLASDPKRRFVVSMGGGGVPSLCGNLVLAELIEALGLREHVEEIWGTSAGAIVGGSWSSGTPASRMREIIFSLRSRAMTDIDWVSLVKGLLRRPFGGTLPDAILHGKHFHEAILSGLAVDTFEECPTPFRCIACNDDPSGRRKVFREGPLAPAISASMSLPGILLPRDENGKRCHGFLDGGLVEKTPLYSPVADHERLGDGRELLIVGTHFGAHTNHNAIAHGFIDRFLVTIDALADHLWEHQEEDARRQPGVTVLLLDARMKHEDVHFDFNAIDRNCDDARAAFEDQLQNAKIALTLGTSCGPRPPCPV
jgi:predicted acylesterase/phospholipase RssA